MKTMETYKVVFDFTGYGALYDSIELIRDGLETVFVQSYNQFVNAVNPNFDIWNAEAEVKGYEGSDDPNSDYIRYIQKKQSDVLSNEVNKGIFETIKSMQPDEAAYEWYIDENCLFHMSLVGDILGLGYIDVTTHVEKI